MRWQHIPTSLTLAGILALGGCTWGDLNKAERRTPVRVYGKAKDFTAPQFGQHMVLLSRTSADEPPTLVVGGQYTTPVAALTLSEGGGVEHFRIAKLERSDVVQHDRGENTIEAITQIDDHVGGAARVIVGVPVDDYIRVVRIPDPDASEPEVIADPIMIFGNPGSSFGTAVAAADVNDDGQREWAVVDDRYVHIVVGEDPDHANHVHCSMDGPGGSHGASRDVKALYSATNDAWVFVASDPDPSGGVVHFVTLDGTSTPVCNVSAPMPAGGPGEEYFGMALAVADLDGDGDDDLIVGSPQADAANVDSHVYVYVSDASGWPPANHPSYIITSEDQWFGDSVAAVDIDGDGTPEILVGDTHQPFGSTGNLGQVHIFQQPWTYETSTVLLTAGDEPLLGDTAEPAKMVGADLKSKTTAFGSTILGIRWFIGDAAHGDRQEVFIGGAKLIYGFYLTGIEDDDGTESYHDPRF